MARGRRRGRRDEPEEVEEIPVAEPMEHGRAARAGPPARAPGGLDFALTASVVGGMAAAVLAFLSVLVMNKVGGADPLDVMDEGGVQAVRMLASFDTSRWVPAFGTYGEHRKRVRDMIQAKIDAARTADSAADELMQPHVDEWLAGVNAEGLDWRPGFDMFFPRNDVRDDALIMARTGAMQRVQGSMPGAYVGCSVIDTGGRALLGDGQLFKGTVLRTEGATEVQAAQGYRIYTHPIYDVSGQPDGRATLVLSTAKAESANVMTTAGAAAGGSFLGAFLVTLMVLLGPVKAMQRLAAETETMARGDLNTRITARGPKAIAATAKNVQRIASMAGSAPSEPQIVTQTVAIAPIEEILEGLAASSTFSRPSGYEIEATSKPCPDAGNDYFDVVDMPDGRLGFIVADIPLRGVKGAMHMAAVRALFRAEAAKSSSPAAILKAVNAGFASDLPRGVYITAMVAALEPATGICRVAAAQHLPLVFWKLARKSSARLTTQGIALGMDKGPVFDGTIEEKAIQLEKGDRIVMFTDGAITARNGAGATYGEQRFYYVVNREAPKNSAAFVNFVANDVDLFHEGASQMDDFTILTIRKVG